MNVSCLEMITAVITVCVSIHGSIFALSVNGKNNLMIQEEAYGAGLSGKNRGG